MKELNQAKELDQAKGLNQYIAENEKESEILIMSRLPLKAAREIYKYREDNNFYETRRKEAFVDIINKRLGNYNSLSKWCREMVEENGGLPMLYKTKNEDGFRRTLSNWKSGIDLPVFVRNLYSEELKNGYTYRNEYIDMLLYFGAYVDGETVSLSIFNKVLSNQGMERLYELDYFDFCVAASIEIERKTGENAYRTFRKLLNDEKLKTIALNDLVGKGVYTRVIEDDFRKISSIGSITDVYENGKRKSFKGVDTVYKFVARYAKEFGRRHLSRYYALASLLVGKSIDETIVGINKTKKIGGFETYDDEEETMERISPEQAITIKLDRDDYQKMLYLLGTNLVLGCHMFLENALGLEPTVEEEEKKEEEKKKKKKKKKEEQKAEQTEEQNAEEEEKKKTTNFDRKYIEEIRIELDSMYNNETMNLYEQDPMEFRSIMENKKNIPREMLLLIILSTCSKGVMKKYIGRHGDATTAKNIMKTGINNMLNLCKMSDLDERNSKYDYLLLLAIEKANYELDSVHETDVNDYEEEYDVSQYPYMDFLINKFFK